MTRSTTTHNSRFRRIFAVTGTTLFWAVVWQILSILVAQELLVPAPSVVIVTLFQLAKTVQFWQITGGSLLRIAAGFLAGVVAGSMAAVLTTRFRMADALLSPMLRIVRAAPVASFIILALVWIPTGRLPAFIAFLMVVPLVWGNVENGIKRIDPNLLEMASVYRLGRVKTLLNVRIPSVMPFFMSACTSAIGLAWKSGIAAEVICRPTLSIGKKLQDAKIYLETPEVFAWTIVVVALSLLLEKLLVAAAKRFGRRFNV